MYPVHNYNTNMDQWPSRISKKVKTVTCKSILDRVVLRRSRQENLSHSLISGSNKDHLPIRTAGFVSPIENEPINDAPIDLKLNLDQLQNTKSESSRVEHVLVAKKLKRRKLKSAMPKQGT